MVVGQQVCLGKSRNWLDGVAAPLQMQPHGVQGPAVEIARRTETALRTRYENSVGDHGGSPRAFQSRRLTSRSLPFVTKLVDAV